MERIRTPIRLAAIAGFLAGALHAQFMPFGSGCAGSRGALELSEPPLARLEIGGAYTLDVRNLTSSSSAFLLLGVGAHRPGIDLSVLGMPGCRLYSTSEVVLPMTNVLGTGTVSFPMPTLPCLTLYAQAAVLDPTANALGVLASNGAKLVVDPVAETYLHRGTSTNTVRNWTFLDEPSINGEPGAIVLTTPVWDPRRGSGINPHPTGVWYDASRARWGLTNRNGATMPAGAWFHALLPNSGATQFVVETTRANTSGHITVLDGPGLSGNPAAVVFVTLNWNPGGGLGVRHESELGVYYDHVRRRWTVFNQDFALMPDGVHFNVLVADEHLAASNDAFVHVADSGSINGMFTYIDHPALNGNPDATLSVTQNWSAHGIYNDHPIGVFFSVIQGQWAILNLDSAPMPVDAGFNVLVGERVPRGHDFVHRADAGNLLGSVSYISDPLLDRAPDALAFCTNNWNPGGGAGVYNAHPIAMGYSPSRGQWGVLNGDSGAMSIGASFNVLIPNTGATQFVHTVEAANRIGHRTVLDHPALNGQRNAIVFVAQNFNPGGGPGRRNPAPIGVWYDSSSSRWEVFNQDFFPLIDGLAFNVLVADDRLEAAVPPFVHRATASNISISGNTTFLDHPALNGQPDAKITVTQYWNPPGSRGVYNDHAIGVMYHRPSGRWAIFNEDRAALPVGAAFNVLVAGACP